MLEYPFVSPRQNPADLYPLARAMPVLFVAIVDRDMDKKMTEFFEKEHVRTYFTLNALGTASSRLLDILGVGTPEKLVALSIGPLVKMRSLLEAAVIKLELLSPGRGIAFTLPISGISRPEHRPAHPGFHELDAHPEHGSEWKQTKEQLTGEWEKEVDKMICSAQHELIVSLINQGFGDDLVDAAKKAGAKGGTLLHARKIGTEETVKFFGISVQAEKEIVAILVGTSEKEAVMRAIDSACGLSTDARGVIFSLPVDAVAGLELLKD